MLALRGDPPRGETEWTAHPGGLRYSVELIRLIVERFDFCVGAACFPEVHPDAPDRESDLRYALDKQEAGASFLITQLFFDNELYFDFVEQARAAGITRADRARASCRSPTTGRSSASPRCAAPSIPGELERELNGRADDPEAVVELGVAYATLQCSDLLARGAPGIHFYTLNRSPATRAILAALRAAHPWTRAGAAV